MTAPRTKTVPLPEMTAEERAMIFRLAARMSVLHHRDIQRWHQVAAVFEEHWKAITTNRRRS